MSIYNILHFSDLHFGEQSIQIKAKFKYDFDNYFRILENTIKDIVNDNISTKLVIISGDIGSKGDIPRQDRYFDIFFEIFSEKKIPIITCLGNHDLIQEEIDKEKQFKIYVDLINSIKIFLGYNTTERSYIYKLSHNFSENQASYIYLKEMNSIFISLNSCKNIELRPIMDKKGKSVKNKDSNIQYMQEFLNVGILTIEDLEGLISEIKSEVGEKNYNKSIKFLICHHNIIEKESLIILKFLKKNNIRIIFSGHEHQYFCLPDKHKLKLINFIAGSPFLKTEERSKNIDFLTYPLQFVRYQLNFNLNTISSYVYEYNAEWNCHIEDEYIPLDLNEYKMTNYIFHHLNEIFSYDKTLFNDFESLFNLDLKSNEIWLLAIGIASLKEAGKTKGYNLQFNDWENETIEMLKSVEVRNKLLNSSENKDRIIEFDEKLTYITMFLAKNEYEQICKKAKWW